MFRFLGLDGGLGWVSFFVSCFVPFDASVFLSSKLAFFTSESSIAISELCSVGKPVILVPSPNVAEDHQTQNAQSLVNKNSAIMVKDVDAKRKLVDELLNLARNASLQEEISINIKRLAVDDAAERIANLSLGLVK